MGECLANQMEKYETFCEFEKPVNAEKRKIDFVSKGGSDKTNSAISLVALLCALSVSGGIALYFILDYEMMLLALGCVAALIILTIIRLIRVTRNRNKSYSAVVVDHVRIKDELEESGTSLGVAVLANIKGKETCIAIPLHNCDVQTEYPLGKNVIIYGQKKYWSIL